MTSRVLGGVFAIGATFAFVAVGAFGAAQHAHSAIQLHATMSTAKQVPLPAVKAPRAQGLFTASLTVRTLSLAAHLPRPFRRCLASRPPSRRQRSAGPTRPQAVRALPVRSARYGDPCRRGGPSRHQPSGLHRHPHAQEPSRRDSRANHIRDRANTPGPLAKGRRNRHSTDRRPLHSHRVHTGPGSGHIVAFVGGLADRISVDLQAGNEPGLAYLPADKRLSGRRDLTFALVKADGSMLANPEARATVYDLTIQGGR